MCTHSSTFCFLVLCGSPLNIFQNTKLRTIKIRYYIIVAVTASQENIQQAEVLLSRLSEDAVERNRKFQQWNDTMAARLQELRNKITQARHAANGVCTEPAF